MSDFIPQELITQILLRLPPKSLLRFRCVSKSWNSLISSPYFISKHTQQSFLSKTQMPRMVLRHFSEAQRVELYSVHHNNEAFPVDNDVNIIFPFRSSSGKFFRIVDFSNGLVCLCDDMTGYSDVIILWNPIMKRKITLPLPRPFHNLGLYFPMLGFGYDVRRNDFKVVRITYVHVPSGNNQSDEVILPRVVAVEVFSLNAGNWREISGTVPQGFVMDDPGTHVLVNAKVHWIAFGRKLNLIQMFDISNEVFEEMALPDALANQPPPHMTISIYKESLAILHKDTGYSIWVMAKYGDGKSWNNMFNVDVNGGVLGFMKNRDLLLIVRNQELASYDPRTQRTIGLGISLTADVSFSDFHADTYTESLALYIEGEQVQASPPNASESSADANGSLLIE